MLSCVLDCNESTWLTDRHRMHGVRFVVSVEGFMVHRPHKSSMASAAFAMAKGRATSEQKDLAALVQIPVQVSVTCDPFPHTKKVHALNATNAQLVPNFQMLMPRAFCAQAETRWAIANARVLQIDSLSQIG